MRYQCSTPATEFYTVMACTILYIFICATLLTVALRKKFNAFRLACLLTVLGELVSDIAAISACSTKPKTINEKFMIRLSVIILKGISAVMLDVALLKLGRSYRAEGLQNTRLFIVTVALTITSSLVLIPFVIYYRQTMESGGYTTVFTVFQYLVTTTRYLSFLLSIVYAFFPMFAIHGVGNTHAPYYSIDARTAAIGTYYMTVAFMWFIFIVLFDVITSVSNTNYYVHVAFFVSAIINCTPPLAFGLQAPYWFVERVRRFTLGHTINRVVIVERGVLSTGILEGNVYDSPL